MANEKLTRGGLPVRPGAAAIETDENVTRGNVMAENRKFIRFTPSATAPQVTPLVNTVVLRGRPLDVGTVHLEVPDEALRQVIADKQLAVTHVYKALDAVGRDLAGFFPKVTDVLPPAIDGVLLNPDGSPAAGVLVEAEAPPTGPQAVPIPWPLPHAIADARGAFRLNLPTVPAPASGLTLRVQGGNGEARVEVKRVMLLEAHLGTLPLPRRLTPAQTSIVTRLVGVQNDLMARSATAVAEKPEEFASPAPQLRLGDGDCGRLFWSNVGVIDSFRYSVLIRLIEPQMNQWQPLFRILQAEGARYVPFALPAAQDALWTATGVQNALAQLHPLGQLVLVNRTPVDQPIDVSDFHRRTEVEPVFLPKASTLGLGYVVGMQQVWIPAGLSLGNLVYSLPLAPGEQQRIAVEERAQTFTDREIETLDQSELQTFREQSDSSALATFRSAFDEVAEGRSHMDSSSRTDWGSRTSSSGWLGAVFGGGGSSSGYSDASSSGNASSWQNVSRDFASSAAQEMHSALGRVAAASRRSVSTSMRLASATERTQLTTRVVTNHNKNHALTMQWWQVLRHYAVTSEVDDVQLVCFVPLELVQFLPSGQPFALSRMPAARAELLDRYAMVLRYLDVLQPLLARNAELAYGMRALKQFAADPSAEPETSNLQQDVLRFELQGSFMPFEEVFVTAIGRSGARLGPVKLAYEASTKEWNIPAEAYITREDLIGHLKSRRLRSDDPAVLRADLALPDWLSRSDIVRFEVARRFTSFSYRLESPAKALGISTPSESWLAIFPALLQAQTVAFGADELERELGGPVLQRASAILAGNVNLLGTGSFFAGEQMGATQPMAALRVGPVLSFNDLLKVEAAFQHVVRNTVRYSKAVWAALSDEERAILLERYTIGVPQGGVTGPDQEVPLLNCVANRVLGFFGNAAVMPFSIPPDVAAKMKITSRDVQDALLKFHRQAFQPPRSSLTLPARGTLGEAVLGSCNSAEKIDLTRFWNWQDSPADTADAIPPSVFTPAQPLAQPLAAQAAAAGSAATGAAGGGGPGSMITISNGPGTQPSTALLEKLIEKAPDLATAMNMAGLDTLQKQVAADTSSAAAGRKEAIDSSTQIQVQAMKTAEGVVKAVANAVASVYGGGAKKDGGDEKDGGGDKGSGDKGGGDKGDAKEGDGAGGDGGGGGAKTTPA